jgi:hypothetical protein
VKHILLSALLLAAFQVAHIPDAAAQTRDKPLAAEPPAGALKCRKVVYVKSASCQSGVQKVTGGCDIGGRGGTRHRTCG